MRIDYYLYRSGKLQRQDFSLVYIHDETKSHLPIGQIDSLYIFGHVEINQNVIGLLNDYGVTIGFFSFYGRYIGKYVPHRKHAGKRIIAHALFVHDENKRLKIAEQIVFASIRNMLFVLKYYHKRKRIDSAGISQVEERIRTFSDDCTRDELLLFEAEIKRIYYRSFPSIILNHQFTFQSRSQYPPQDEINALMSFGYAMLYAKIEGDIHRSRLVLELPFVHGHSKADSGLQHDIADIFKPIFVDRLIFSMINKKVITPDHFEERDHGTYLTREGMGVFIAHFDTYLKRTTPIQSKHHTYRRVLTREVQQICNLIFDQKPYKPFVMTRW